MKKSSNLNKRIVWWTIGLMSFLIIYFLIKVFTQPENNTPLLAGNYTCDTLFINSKILNEQREVLIYKPLDYEQGDSVSLIYLLDGEYAIYRMNLIAGKQFSKSVIGIGIVNTNRRRDLIPENEADKFLDFISNELIAEIDTNFLIDQRILFGHSNAGGFTVYSMINAPTLFDKYIASSPTTINKMIDIEMFKNIDSLNKTEIKLYFSHGSKDKKRVKDGSEKLLEILNKLKLCHFEYWNEIYEGENHNSSANISLIKGLRY